MLEAIDNPADIGRRNHYLCDSSLVIEEQGIVSPVRACSRDEMKDLRGEELISGISVAILFKGPRYGGPISLRLKRLLESQTTRALTEACGGCSMMYRRGGRPDRA